MKLGPSHSQLLHRCHLLKLSHVKIRHGVIPWGLQQFFPSHFQAIWGYNVDLEKLLEISLCTTIWIQFLFRLWLKEKEENVQSLSFLCFRNVSLERCLGICLLLALDLLLTITSPTDQSLDSSRRAFPKDASSSKKRRLGVATQKKTQSEHQPPRMGLNMLIICNV